jgi:hypothetical protein
VSKSSHGADQGTAGGPGGRAVASPVAKPSAALFGPAGGLPAPKFWRVSTASISGDIWDDVFIQIPTYPNKLLVLAYDQQKASHF